MNRSACVAFESIGEAAYDDVNTGEVDLIKCTGDHSIYQVKNCMFFSYKTLYSTRGANLLLSECPLVHN